MARNKYVGYKIAILRDGKIYSIYQPNLQIAKFETGGITRFDKFYLATSKQFALDLYSGLTDDVEVLLNYEYSDKDIVFGGPPNHPYSEIVVSEAKLINIEVINHE